jgi:DNA repair protein RecN (Recombination protein N)
MLKELRIRNLAIIEDLTIAFEKGLNVLTGETGAGKSIIVDALGLALGDRAQSDMIKSGAREATVQAFFEPDESISFPDIGVDLSEGIVLRRVISSSGKSRAFINDTIVTLQTLSESGRSLVDIHSQHEHQSLLLPEKQRRLLDYYGKLHPHAERVAALYRETAGLKTEYEEISRKGEERARKIDMLMYQIKEIDAASLKAGEKEELEEQRKILLNMHKLNEWAETAYAFLYDSEGSSAEKLSRAVTLVRDMSGIDAGMKETLTILESAVPLIEEATINLRSCRDRYDLESSGLETVEERLEIIRNLEKKYGKGIEAVLNFRDAAAKELGDLASTDERAASIGKELASAADELWKAAEDLSEKRKQTASELSQRIGENLSELAFGSASFCIDAAQTVDADGHKIIGPHGMDRIEFLFSANPGEPLKPLSKIASGGELSRVMLALKSILAEEDKVPVLIFDEVDAGIGGRTAESVGKKLSLLADTHQILCITHLPQIASFGDVHIRIEKKARNGRVFVDVKELSGSERRDEIARMLSGKITEISLRHAGELLERVK